MLIYDCSDVIMNVLLGHLNLLVLANFLSITRHTAANRMIKDKQTGPPLYGILCPDWIKWAGMPKHLHEQWAGD